MSESPTPTPPVLPASGPAASVTEHQGLRRRAARGTLMNAGFLAALTSLGLVKGFAVAGFLSRRDFGVWGVLVVTLGTLGWLKQVGIGDRYIQQEDDDQELAFQRAFTLELVISAGFFLLALLVVGLMTVVYARPELLAPGLAVIMIIPALVLQSPLWVFWRRLEFFRQRSLEAIDPVVEFVVTVGLAAAGAGYWSLVVGLLAGNYASALAIVRASPYRLAFRYDRGTLRQYVRFSWPLVAAGAGGIVVAQSSVLVGNAALGLAGVGSIALASSIALYTTQVDQILTATLYPAICKVRDRADLLFESFVKSNKLGLMWGVPLGVGIALFAPDLVRYGLGAHWQPAVALLQVFGLVAAVDQLGYNWDAYYRARGETRPIAVVSLAAMLAFVCVALPLLVTDGLRGFGIGMAVTAVVTVAARAFYLVRLFPAFGMARHAARAIAPTIPAAAAALAVRAIDGHRTLGVAAAEVAVFVVAVVAATLLIERSLLREIAGYLRGATAPAAEAPV
ncbi:MAG: oligosaccharide flippase family protein [Solirubrobacteraceae bacterium]